MEIVVLFLALLLVPAVAFGTLGWWGTSTATGRRVAPMRLVAAMLLLAAIACGAFAWWGTSTVAGRARYDEMDALYPVLAGALAVLFVLLASGFGWLALRRARRPRSA